MRATMKLSPLQLSKQLKELSLWLFIHEPVDYLQSVLKAWKAFWGSNQKVVNETSIESSWLKAYMNSSGPLIFLRGCYCAMLLAMALQILRFRSQEHRYLNRLCLLLGSCVFFQCTFLAFFTYGSGPRYASCYYPLVILTICIAPFPHFMTKRLFAKQDAPLSS